MTSDPDAIPGTWDFFQDAKELLADSGTSFFLVCGQEGNRTAWHGSNLHTRAGVQWFRERIIKSLADLEATLPE